MKGFDTPLALVGNSLAVQVAATERARRGLPTLVINPGGPWGGYFAGVKAGGTLWDAGMVAFEFTSFRTPGSPPAIASYDPMRRNDIGRFTHAVRSYVEEHLPTRAIRPLQMWLDDRLLPDLLLGNALEALSQLGCKQAVREELRSHLSTALASPWHAQRKDLWPHVDVPDYDTVSRINHGRVLHDAVIAPFARKVLGRDAGHHRFGEARGARGVHQHPRALQVVSAMAARRELEVSFEQGTTGPEFGQDFIFGHRRTP
jgi:hypothetical protein